MTVRDKSGRKRYVAVGFEPFPRNRGEASRAIESSMDRALYASAQIKLIFVEDGIAVIRCSHDRLGAVVEALNCQRGTYSLKTLGASGTLKALRSML